MNNITTKNSIKALAIILAMAVFVWFMWSMIVSSVSNFTDTLAADGNIKSATQVKLDNMRRELRSSDRYIQKLSTMTINKESIPSLLNELESQGGVETEVVVSDVSEDPVNGVVRVSLTLNCSLVECIDTAKEVANIRGIVGVPSLSLLEKGDGDWVTNMTIAIPINIQDR